MFHYDCLTIADEEALCVIHEPSMKLAWLGFLTAEMDEAFVLSEAARDLKEAAINKDKKGLVQAFVNKLLAKQGSYDLNDFYIAKGTDFQRQAWQALCELEEGDRVSYGQIAKKIERDRAVRAVGAAIGANMISYFIPCHRVVGANQNVTGYRWGLEVKTRLLEKENQREKAA